MVRIIAHLLESTVRSDSQIFLGSKLEPPEGGVADPPPDGAGCLALRRRGFIFGLLGACTRISAVARSCAIRSVTVDALDASVVP